MAWFALLFAAWCLSCATAEHFIDKSLDGLSRKTVENPAAEFTQLTGLTWPPSAGIITAGDSSGGFPGDGELYFVFDADLKTLTDWLSKTPPWGDEWKAGGVPEEIRSYCFFGQEPSIPPTPNRHQDALAASHIQYCGKVYNPAAESPWDNGWLLAIDSKRGRVYCSSWSL